MNSDLKHGEIAEKLKISKNTLSNWLNSEKTPAFTEEYERLLKIADETRKRVYRTKAQKALDKLVDLVDSPDKKVALAACKEILDRAGDKPDINLKGSVAVSQKIEDLI
jgi:transcriptional regulator with XRE-family HTH domain